MTLDSASILIAEMVSRTQGIVEAANKIESLYKLAAAKQDNPHFNRVLYQDAQDNLGAVIKLEDKLYSYADLLRCVAGISIEDGKSLEQPGSGRKANRGN